MKKKLMLTLALLGAATAQSAHNKTISYNNSNGDGFMSEGSMGFQQPTSLGTQKTGPLPTSLISQGLIKAIKMVDPKNPANLAKAHALKAKALSALSDSQGIIAPEALSGLTQWINTLESRETLFIMSCFLTSLLYKVNHYRTSFHSGATIQQAVSKTPKLWGHTQRQHSLSRAKIVGNRRTQNAQNLEKFMQRGENVYSELERENAERELNRTEQTKRFLKSLQQ